MRHLRILSVVLLGALLGGGCNAWAPGSSGVPPDDAAGKGQLHGDWQLERLHGEPVEVASRAGRAVTLALSPDGAASGYGGCNRYSTTYERRDEELEFGRVTATKMACPDTMDLERAYFSVLDDTRAYRLEEGGLVLLDGAGTALARLQAAEPSKPVKGD